MIGLRLQQKYFAGETVFKRKFDAKLLSLFFSFWKMLSLAGGGQRFSPAVASYPVNWNTDGAASVGVSR